METLQFTILQLQCILIFFTLWKIRQWILKLNKRQDLYYEGYQGLFKAYEQSNEMNKELVKLLQDHNYKITGLSKRLENTEHNYKVMKDLSDHDRDTNENVYIALAKMRDKINNLENGNSNS